MRPTKSVLPSAESKKTASAPSREPPERKAANVLTPMRVALRARFTID
jgi:hypothetical protein